MDKDAALMQIYTEVIKFAHSNNQVVGENNDFYITLEQLEAIMMKFLSIPKKEEEK